MIIKLDEKRKKMTQREMFYEGTEKSYYFVSGENAETQSLVLNFKDDLVLNASKKQSVIAGKGIFNNRISGKIHEILQEFGFPSYYIKTMNMREQLLSYVDIIPLKMRVRHIASQSFSKDFGMEAGRRFFKPLVDFLFEVDDEEVMVSEGYLQQMLGLVRPDIELLSQFAIRMSEFLSGYFLGIGLRLIDIKFRFGRTIDEEGDVYYLLCSTLTPDSFTVWDYNTNENFSRERFLSKSKSPEKIYYEVAKRMGVVTDQLDGVL